LWSAGHGVATLHAVEPVETIIARIVEEYRDACAIPPSSALAKPS
jgi:nitronate monooxygenase